MIGVQVYIELENGTYNMVTMIVNDTIGLDASDVISARLITISDESGGIILPLRVLDDIEDDFGKGYE